MLESVEYGNSKIEFKLKRSNRKSLGISVLPCGTVEVTAPADTSIDKIKSLLVKRGSWIEEQKLLTRTNPVIQPSK